MIEFGVTYATDQNGEPLFPMIWERDGATVKTYGVGDPLKNGDTIKLTWECE